MISLKELIPELINRTWADDMNNKQNNLLSMYRTVVSIVKANATEVAKVGAFESSFNVFESKVTAIINTAQQRDMVLTGITGDKTAKKRELAQMTATIATVVKGYAKTVGNKKLADQMDFSESELFKLKDEDLITNATNIYNSANEVLLDLVNYNITEQTLDALLGNITVFSLKKPAPTVAISLKESLTAQLEQLFAEANAILKDQMDNTSKMFVTYSPSFYALYSEARKIIDRGKGKGAGNALKGVVKTMLADGTLDVVTDALVQLVEKKMVAVTDGKGAFNFGNVTPAMYTLKAIKKGYNETEMGQVEVIKGVDKVVDLVLAKI